MQPISIHDVSNSHPAKTHPRSLKIAPTCSKIAQDAFQSMPNAQDAQQNAFNSVKHVHKGLQNPSKIRTEGDQDVPKMLPMPEIGIRSIRRQWPSAKAVAVQQRVVWRRFVRVDKFRYALSMTLW